MMARHLLVLAAAAVAGLLIGAPAEGQVAATPAIVASDYQFNAAGGGAPNVTIAPGATVGFSYPSGGDSHNVAFTGPQPASCTVATSGVTAGATGPLPTKPSSAGWAGSCTFTAVGTYAFVCELHGNMTGSVTVPNATTAPPPVPPPVPPPPPLAVGPAASALRVTTLQRGFTVRGSVHVRSAGSRLLARAFARRNALLGGRSRLQVQVGRQLRPSVGGARVSFAVQLNATARRALRRNGRLSITLRLTVTPPDEGSAYTATRTVILRAL